MILEITENWKKLFQIESDKINEASVQLHYADQFIAILGKYLLEENTDDSHTTGEWLQEHDLLAGKWIKGSKLFRIALDIANFRIVFLDNEIKEISSVELNGKTQTELLEWVKSVVANLGLSPDIIKSEMHYQIPGHGLAHGETYSKPSEEILLELSKLRYNAHLVLSFLTSKIKNSEPVRVWPHHFDSGTIIPIEKDIEGILTKSIGLGLAVANDDIANEHYFYVSPWSSKKNFNFESLPDLTNSGKWHIQSWTGAYLPISEINKLGTKEEQMGIVNGFLLSAIDACLYLLDSTGLFSNI